ncbi:MAG: hypothetical protein ABGX47_04220 [Martelella sp.]
MPPARQNLHSAHRTVLAIPDQLIEWHDLALGNRILQFKLKHLMIARGVDNFGIIHHKPPATVLLGLVHRRIGLLQQHLPGTAIARIDSDADAGRGGDHASKQRYRYGDRGKQTFRDLFGQIARHIAFDKRCEFVTAKPSEKVLWPQALLQSLGHLLQKAVAGLVAEIVVDLLEPVEIDEQDCKPVGLAPRTR